MDVDHLAGLVWHHVLHARSSIERGRPWQAEYWISAVRNLVLTLASHRHGEPTIYAEGVDALPTSVTSPLEGTLVHSLDERDLSRALQNVAQAAMKVLAAHDRDLTKRLETPLLELASRADDPEESRRAKP